MKLDIIIIILSIGVVIGGWQFDRVRECACAPKYCTSYIFANEKEDAELHVSQTAPLESVGSVVKHNGVDYHVTKITDYFYDGCDLQTIYTAVILDNKKVTKKLDNSKKK
jgi:hypothetical protein